jgi:hypothetical protein
VIRLWSSSRACGVWRGIDNLRGQRKGSSATGGRTGSESGSSGTGKGLWPRGGAGRARAAYARGSRPYAAAQRGARAAVSEEVRGAHDEVVAA